MQQSAIAAGACTVPDTAGGAYKARPNLLAEFRKGKDSRKREKRRRKDREGKEGGWRKNGGWRERRENMKTEENERRDAKVYCAT